MATYAIVILALFLQGVYSRPQTSETSDTTNSGVTINLEGSGSNLIQSALEIPIDAADMGVSFAQGGVDAVRQFLNTLFESSTTGTGSGSVHMSVTQPDWSSMTNLIQQGLSASSSGAAVLATESANQMMSRIMSFMNQPEIMTMIRQLINSGVLTQGEGTTVNIDVTKLPSEYAKVLVSALGTSEDGSTVKMDVAQPGSWDSILTFIPKAMSVANDGMNLAVDSVKLPMDFASQGMDIMRQFIPGQSSNSVSMSASHPASSLTSFGNSLNRLVASGSQMPLNALQIPIDAANNGIGAAREFMTGTDLQNGINSVTLSSGGTESNGLEGSVTLTGNGMSGSTNGLGGLINAGANLARNGLGLGLDMTGTGIGLLRSTYGGLRTPLFSFSTRNRGY